MWNCAGRQQLCGNSYMTYIVNTEHTHTQSHTRTRNNFPLQSNTIIPPLVGNWKPANSPLNQPHNTRHNRKHIICCKRGFNFVFVSIVRHKLAPSLSIGENGASIRNYLHLFCNKNEAKASAPLLFVNRGKVPSISFFLLPKTSSADNSHVHCNYEKIKSYTTHLHNSCET